MKSEFLTHYYAVEYLVQHALRLLQIRLVYDQDCRLGARHDPGKYAVHMLYAFKWPHMPVI